MMCLKQRTFCRIVRKDGQEFGAYNSCAVIGDECPRVASGCKSGEGYDLCRSVHAEVNAAILAQKSKGVPGKAYIYGHTWVCKDCQDALRAVGVTEFKIIPELQFHLDPAEIA